MRLHYYLIFSLLIFTTNNRVYSQVDKREKVFITSNSLTFVYLLPNQKFGYVSFQKESPLSYKYNKIIIKGHLDAPYFLPKESGSGKYLILEGKLHLNFIKPKHTIDSISLIKTICDSDSINIKISFKSYVSLKNTDRIGIDSIIKSSDNSIDINTGFNTSTSFKINKNVLPLKLQINGKYDLMIKDKKNHDISLYINEYKAHASENIKNKIFDTDSLSELKK